MLKVLIVDDEAIVRIGLKSMIDWEEHGFELIGEANDGRRALELYKEHKPDIVITDLKMPVLDGLGLIQQIKELPFPCRIIVLSSYDDFALVRQAMKLGAADYLLKLEMEPAELLKILAGFRHEILQEKETQFRQAQIEQEVKTNLSTLRRAFLKETFCSAEFSPERFKEGLERLEIKLNPNHIYCLVLQIGSSYWMENMNAEEINSRQSAIITVCEEVICSNNFGCCFQTKEREFVILLSPKKDPVTVNHIVSDCRNLVQILQQYLGVTAVMGIGSRASCIDQIPCAYAEAREAVKYRFFKETEQIIQWSQVQSLPSPKAAYSVLPYRSQLEKAFFYRQVSEICICLDSISRELAEIGLAPEAACSGALELCSIIHELIEREQLQPEDILTASHHSYGELLHMANWDELLNWLQKLKEDLIAFIQAEEEKESWIISEAKRFIQEHYDEEISLTEVANSVGLTPSYFSTVFKEHVGTTYSDYLTTIRIEKAKQLLRSTAYRVYEISHMVGYENHYYFNRLFKKIVGLTPLDYRKSKIDAT